VSSLPPILHLAEDNNCSVCRHEWEECMCPSTHFLDAMAVAYS
jgi:hypothetical protein